MPQLYSKSLLLWQKVEVDRVHHSCSCKLEEPMQRQASIKQVMTCSFRGLRLMAERGQQRRLIATSARILRAMEGQGDHKQATKLKRAIDQLMDEYGLEIPPTSPSPARPKLPPKCPQCGGSVHPDEVKWHSDQTAVCVYCGSILEPQL
ncbi:MAG: hypothetical protein IIC78_02880 [Chloroflexi bacterium]|nr:hypothetical protein [Chloroflexota bacterium]